MPPSQGKLQRPGGARAAGAADAGRPAGGGAGQQLRRAVAVSAQSRRDITGRTVVPDFDDNLRQAMRRETELLFDSIMREDRSVLDLLRPNYTFFNERLAKHYGIPKCPRQPLQAGDL